MRYLWELIKHFLLSNSRHGTHSPFVYRLAEQAIYVSSAPGSLSVDFPEDFLPDYKGLLANLLTFMEIGQLAYLDGAGTADAVWTAIESEPVDRLAQLIEQGKLLVVHEPMRNRTSRKKWKALLGEPAVVVSINLFHFGLVLRRDGQRKEHFKLRYPYFLRR